MNANLIAIHGKYGAGKNETSKQIRLILETGSEYEEKAFAARLKETVAALVRSSIEDQYTESGKNTIYIHNERECEKLDYYKAAYALCGYPENQYGQPAMEIRTHPLLGLNLMDVVVHISTAIRNSTIDALKEGGKIEFSGGKIQQELGTRLRNSIDRYMGKITV